MNTRLWGIVATVLALHILGWSGLLLASSGAAATVTLATGVTAYVLGLRHAFDADHIAAIDSATRALASRKPRPVAVGLFFSLGHSSVVFILVLLLVLGIQVLAGSLVDDSSLLHTLTAVWGPLFSGTFLLMIASFNIVALRSLRRNPDGLLLGGPLYRLLGPVVKNVADSRHMYPIGFLFGLGFDTATEIGLLTLAGSATLVTSNWYAVLCLPILFAAGMTALDSADGVLMARLYEWSMDWPTGRNLVNVAMTGLTVALAASIGLLELVTLVGDWLGFAGGFWDFLNGINMQWLGVWSIALFAVAWIWARVAYKRMRQPMKTAMPSIRNR